MLWLAYAALLIPLGVVCFLVWSLVFGEAGADDRGRVPARDGGGGRDRGRRRCHPLPVVRDRSADQPDARLQRPYRLARPASTPLVSLLAGVVVGRGSTWVTALAVLVVAVAFGPLRSRAQAAGGLALRPPALRGVATACARSSTTSARGGESRRTIGAVVAAALRDPSAELLFRLPASDAYADRLGTVVLTPVADGRSLTKVEHRGQEIGLLRHNRALLARPDLLRSVLAAASLAIEIARLRVEVRIQLAEVEESRARVVRAGYEERRRLERDLHDGAQQRLVTLGIVLRRLQRSLPREAQILGPALGLGGRRGRARDRGSAHDRRGRAAATAGRRARGGARRPRPRRTRPRSTWTRLDQRLPEEVEAAAYFVVCEAVTNAVKHGSPSRVRVEATIANGALRLVVVDDGSGGATRPAEPGSRA